MKLYRLTIRIPMCKSPEAIVMAESEVEALSLVAKASYWFSSSRNQLTWLNTEVEQIEEIPQVLMISEDTGE